MKNFIATIPQDEITKFCHRWKIRELALFGSSLHNDFTPNGDLDFLVIFATDSLNQRQPMQRDDVTVLDIAKSARRF